MLSKFSTKQKTFALVIAGVLILGWVFVFTSIVKFAVNQLTLNPTSEPPIEITYCGAIPEGICILSFGRDGSGDTIINLFVAPTQFPDFYLKVNKTSGEVIYECEKSDDVETSVYCIGEAILLGEQVEITIFSIEGDIPIAYGKFAVTAILVVSQNEGLQSLPSQTGTPSFTTQPISTIETVSPTSSLSGLGTESITPTPDLTITATPSVSYPNYP
jgi:hypothetical protein